MFAKKTLVSALIAAGGLGAVALPLPSAAASFDFFFNTTPARHDTYYGRGHYQPSRFDRDGDGIPNRRDPTPDGFGPRWDRDNDGIANRYDRTPDGEVRTRDRDGDGVPNRFDNYPDNPRWR
jgi:Thrombospondin type 3 repeat